MIALWLETPPNVLESDDDLEVTDRNSDKNGKEKQTASSKPNTYPEQLKACVSTNYMSQHGEKVLMTMNREHSMLMNCIPLTRDMLGNDVLAKI